MLHTGMLKAFMDGSLGSHTASLMQPYADDPKNSGFRSTSRSKLNEMAAERLAAGFQLGFHAIGDKAVQMALDAFAEAEKSAHQQKVKAIDGSENYRLRIEHAQVTNPMQVDRFRELSVTRFDAAQPSPDRHALGGVAAWTAARGPFLCLG